MKDKCKLLIVVDMQHDFIDGELGSQQAKNICYNVAQKVQQYLNSKDYIIFTKDTHYKDNYHLSREWKCLPVLHCIKETHGWNLVEGFETILDEPNVICINKFDQFGLDPMALLDLKSYIEYNHINEIEIVGVATNMCVISVAICIQNILKNMEITIDASCCTSFDPILHKEAIDVMRSLNMNIINE